ncbi:lateral flagellin LafA [Vibrio sp. B1FLJ16]|uniref:lateral flagellin LafA n=1 Tax=Vibrio sp. B1FLJ16 TaxID=2751178 RepID=UPI0015F3B8D3|nr:lateral flagellin LafA [Vibrio sp. B1FLJ16]CAD7821880.1 Flagellin is the subunit protein which polymerizes to form the filaments of bacterial flagella [Vibrio sp. B1FLJ16]CAD7823410.1 Flagellin is the subunit protein which polymerizes to form the filaments of bacterial flagella [Vibrio sp. B1FLJ16]CAE6947448.1 Flagellin is the subunit protein which polymerizes to form the filaments of bacterial flagella [Vibrio sp. B1FLJ16]CAE6951815.1 Flagellin is the subunit protein which polymerizes to fo
MALSMHTNYASLVTQNTLSSNNELLTTAMERLSTGLRINSAADDAAGLTIANKLEAQTRGMSVAMRNSQDAISMLQTADGALDEITNIAYRMKDLATQASNGTNGTTELAALDAEYQELKTEATRILTETTYGAGQKLLVGGKLAAAVDFQIGASAAETLTFDMSADLTTLNTAATTGIGGLTTNALANAEITAVDGLFDVVNTVRSSLGANINRLDHTINNLANVSENTAAAKGRITDADFAVESSNMTKNQMLMQAGTTVLSQTNQLPGMAMSLLR